MDLAEISRTNYFARRTKGRMQMGIEISTGSENSHRFRGSTFESMLETFTGSFGPLSVQPVGKPSDFRWSADFSGANGVTMVSSHHKAGCYMQVTAEKPQFVSVMLPRMGGVELACGSRTYPGVRGDILLTNDVEPERVGLVGDTIAVDGLLFDHALFAQATAAILDIPLSGPLELAPVLALPHPAGRVIGGLAETMIAGLRGDGPLLQSPLALANLSSAFADLVIRLVPHRLSHLLDRRMSTIAPWHVRRAISFMHANIDQQITIPMICQAVGVSVRALENGFRAFKGTTPAAYLRSIRLTAARCDLVDPSNSNTVQAICLKWGFFHFGRFSALYRSTYGEGPSETKKRIAKTFGLS